MDDGSEVDMVSRRMQLQLPAESSFERRAVHRRAGHIEGWLRVRGENLAVVVVDLSATGAGVVLLAPHAFDAGDEAELALQFASVGDERWLPCSVRWQEGTRVGLSFAFLLPRTRSAILRAFAELGGR
jgi:hypothetical protein